MYRNANSSRKIGALVLQMSNSEINWHARFGSTVLQTNIQVGALITALFIDYLLRTSGTLVFSLTFLALRSADSSYLSRLIRYLHPRSKEIHIIRNRTRR